MTITIAKAVLTCPACPSQWDAWTDAGQYLYLRYRGGYGTVDDYPDNRDEFWDRVPDGRLASFNDDDRLAGEISLTEFCQRAGLLLAADAAIS